jgi:hypothetical protein
MPFKRQGAQPGMILLGCIDGPGEAPKMRGSMSTSIERAAQAA